MVYNSHPEALIHPDLLATGIPHGTYRYC